MIFVFFVNKNKLNKKKHGISFEVAVRVFLDDRRIEKIDFAHSTAEEERLNIIGMVENLIILFVVTTERSGKIRIISARRAEKKEEEEYYANYDIERG